MVRPVANDSSYDLAAEFGSLTAQTKDGLPFLRAGLTDTETVLQGTSLIDEYLKFVLITGFNSAVVSKRLIEAVFSGHGPLATFSAKISVCTALGLVLGDVRHDLGILRNIRNDFAHSYAGPKLSDCRQCESLRVTANVTVIDDNLNRRKFKLSCAGILPHLAVSALLDVAKGRFISANAEAVKIEYQKMLTEIYNGPELPE